jgi:hypothetical protein
MMKSLTLAALILATTGAVAQAGVIERACLKSDRRAASKTLCVCIQKAADVTLSNNDQRLAAKFFSEPHMAQEIRQSDNSQHEVFWKRYRTFGNTAASYCG